MTGGGGGSHRGRVTNGPGTGAHWWGGRGPAGGGTHAARVGGRRGVLLIALLAVLLVGGVVAGVALTRTSADTAPAAAAPGAPAAAPGSTTSRSAGAPDTAVLQQTIDEVLVATPLRFPADSATPNAEATAAVDRLAGVLRASPVPTVTVEGHTAPTGEDTGDAQALSQQRAEDVVRRLEAAGVPAGSLTAVGVGSERPLDSLEASRRVEVRVG